MKAPVFCNRSARQAAFPIRPLAAIDPARATYFLRTPASVVPRLCVAAFAEGVSPALP
jgi:hypothetical protein